MTPDRAHEIVKAINDRCMFTMGLVEIPGSLKDVTLAEMLEAKACIEAKNDAAESVGGTRSISLVPDDRLIAAAYCMEHYPVSNEVIVILPTVRSERFWHETDRKALAVVPLNPNQDDEEDD